MSRFARIELAITRASAGLAILGGLGLIFATFVTCVSILLKLTRRLLDAGFSTVANPELWAGVRSILGEEELVAYGVGLALFAALPWVMIQKGHVRIDLFEPVFGERLNRLLDFLGDLVLAAIAYLILTRQWFLIFKPARRSQEPMSERLLSGDLTVLGDRLRDTEESQILALPLWPTYIVAELCVAAFFLVACFCVLRSGRALVLGRSA